MKKHTVNEEKTVDQEEV